MITKTFPKQTMLDLLDDAKDTGLEIISDKLTSVSRWSKNYTIIFKEGEDLYRAKYSCGATEVQEETPWEWDKEVVAVKVVPKEVTTTIYEDAE